MRTLVTRIVAIRRTLTLMLLLLLLPMLLLAGTLWRSILIIGPSMRGRGSLSGTNGRSRWAITFRTKTRTRTGTGIVRLCGCWRRGYVRTWLEGTGGRDAAHRRRTETVWGRGTRFVCIVGFLGARILVRVVRVALIVGRGTHTWLWLWRRMLVHMGRRPGGQRG